MACFCSSYNLLWFRLLDRRSTRTNFIISVSHKFDRRTSLIAHDAEHIKSTENPIAWNDLNYAAGIRRADETTQPLFFNSLHWAWALSLSGYLCANGRLCPAQTKNIFHFHKRLHYSLCGSTFFFPLSIVYYVYVSWDNNYYEIMYVFTAGFIAIDNRNRTL